MSPGRARPGTHRGREEGLSVHGQHGPQVPVGGQGLPLQGEVEAQDNGAHGVLHTLLRERWLGSAFQLPPPFPRGWAGAARLTGNCSLRVSHVWLSPKTRVRRRVLFLVSWKTARGRGRVESSARS